MKEKVRTIVVILLIIWGGIASILLAIYADDIYFVKKNDRLALEFYPSDVQKVYLYCMSDEQIIEEKEINNIEDIESIYNFFQKAWVEKVEIENWNSNDSSEFIYAFKFVLKDGKDYSINFLNGMLCIGRKDDAIMDIYITKGDVKAVWLSY